MNREAYQEFYAGLDTINLEYQKDLEILEAQRIDKIAALWKQVQAKHPDWDIDLLMAFRSHNNNPLLMRVN